MKALISSSQWQLFLYLALQQQIHPNLLTNEAFSPWTTDVTGKRDHYILSYYSRATLQRETKIPSINPFTAYLAELEEKVFRAV